MKKLRWVGVALGILLVLVVMIIAIEGGPKQAACALKGDEWSDGKCWTYEELDREYRYNLYQSEQKANAAATAEASQRSKEACLLGGGNWAGTRCSKR